MNQLLPIIRRVRRPLVVADKPPMVAGSVECEPHGQTEMVNEVLGETPKTTGETPVPPNPSHAAAPTNRKSR